ncbi:DNA-3-methyladenine glycosylase family protein [Auraticoccus monumenti]|uniref:DNA-3-methyladenine glycosylase II n=1 Tax=Auraticoccus monumenti TaxID=675864 RepID=A0A1G6ZXN2_9ACTN|nr:DNA-3-methyladenine glycosylase [Auraticoccus monumenti]SDE07241.1 DNA-3-methyladenine glycosylase II [Auraticoccus monumenti]
MELDAEGFALATDQLAEADPRLAAVLSRWGRPGFWHRPPSFATLVLLVLEQQVSLASGKATFDRLRARAGGVVTVESTAALSLDDLRAVGCTRQKAGYLAGLAAGVLDGSVPFDAITRGPRQECRAALLALRGIGPWTADVWLLACRGFPDEWPVGDRALQVGCGDVLGTGSALVGEELVAAGQPWAPHRSTAARLVWHDYLCRRGRAETVVDGLDPVGGPDS